MSTAIGMVYVYGECLVAFPVEGTMYSIIAVYSVMVPGSSGGGL